MALLETLQDDFAFKDESKWRHKGGTSWQAYEAIVSGQLQLTCRSDYLAQLESVATYDWTNSYAYVNIAGRPFQGGDNSTEMSFGIRSNVDTTDYVELILTGAGGITYNVYINGSGSSADGFTTYDASTMAYLRWRNSGTTVYLERSANGTTWTVMNTWTGVSGFDFTAVRPYMGVGYYGTQSTPGNALYDNFNTTTALGTGGGATGTVTVDATTTSPTTTGVTSKSWAHACAGANRFLLLAVELSQSASAETLGTPTYGGVAMTALGSQVNAGSAGTNRIVQLYYMIAPPVGSANIVISCSATTATINGTAASFNGAHQTTPTGTPVTSSTTAATSAGPTVSSATGELVYTAAYARATSYTTTPTQSYANYVVGTNNLIGMSIIAGASSVTATWAINAAGNLAITAVAIKPAPAPKTAFFAFMR